MMPANLVKPREAAQILGISYPTIKQWIYKRKLRTVKTAGGHHRVPQSEIDRFLHRIPNRLDVAERRRNFRRISGRNQLVGRVLDIKTSGLLAQVTLSIGEQRITAIVTADAIRHLAFLEAHFTDGIGGDERIDLGSSLVEGYPGKTPARLCVPNVNLNFVLPCCLSC